MKITSVKVKKFDNEDSRMKGIVTVVLDDCIAIHGIRIILKQNEDGTEKYILAMPNRVSPNGEKHDIVHPINEQTRNEFEKVILDEYKKAED